MKKIIILFIGIIFVIFIAYKTVSILYTAGYKIGGTMGYSRTIIESKERGVFVKELEYIIIPDSIKLIKGKRFFIEKGFRYGESSAKVTSPLKVSDDYIYQIGSDPLPGEQFIGSYLLGNGDFGQFRVMKDTFKCDIITKVPQYDSIYKVGELILFDKK
ncbi:MAG: hypothetical protein CVU01_01225 [Bacteroidetes bacterium HGW-Bacteroidetes-18]|nr:MAG: hypothetical protein CVU01_01225 [Bacteroidetes bacterium HGW-Bacteroidetes-18]